MNANRFLLTRKVFALTLAFFLEFAKIKIRERLFSLDLTKEIGYEAEKYHPGNES